MTTFQDILQVEQEARKRLESNTEFFVKYINEQIAEAVRETIDRMGLVTTLPEFGSDAMAERNRIVEWLSSQELYYKMLPDPDSSTALRYAVIRNRIKRGIHWEKKP